MDRNYMYINYVNMPLTDFVVRLFTSLIVNHWPQVGVAGAFSEGGLCESLLCKILFLPLY